MKSLHKLKIGCVVEYKNTDDDFKKAIIIGQCFSSFKALTFTGREVTLTFDETPNYTWISGRITSLIANNLAEFIAGVTI